MLLRAHNTLCPRCQEAPSSAPLLLCSKCRTLFHADCLDQAARCPSTACRTPPATRERWTGQWWKHALVGTALGGVVGWELGGFHAPAFVGIVLGAGGGTAIGTLLDHLGVREPTHPRAPQRTALLLGLVACAVWLSFALLGWLKGVDPPLWIELGTGALGLSAAWVSALRAWGRPWG